MPLARYNNADGTFNYAAASADIVHPARGRRRSVPHGAAYDPPPPGAGPGVTGPPWDTGFTSGFNARVAEVLAAKAAALEAHQLATQLAARQQAAWERLEADLSAQLTEIRAQLVASQAASAQLESLLNAQCALNMQLISRVNQQFPPGGAAWPGSIGDRAASGAGAGPPPLGGPGGGRAGAGSPGQGSSGGAASGAGHLPPASAASGGAAGMAGSAGGQAPRPPRAKKGAAKASAPRRRSGRPPTGKPRRVPMADGTRGPILKGLLHMTRGTGAYGRRKKNVTRLLWALVRSIHGDDLMGATKVAAKDGVEAAIAWLMSKGTRGAKEGYSAFDSDAKAIRVRCRHGHRP